MQTAGKVVVKVIITHDKDRHNRAKREMNWLQAFHENRNICSLINGIAVDAVHGVPARCGCILPYYELGTVQTLLKNGQPEFTTQSTRTSCLLLKNAVDMAKDVLSGLECMHGMKIVHRDIKPGNICVKLLPVKDEVRLRYIIIDLGAAVAIKRTVESVESVESTGNSTALFTGMTFTGQFTSVAGQKMPLGTAPFMSPEHIDPSRDVDGRADIFSLGVTMYVCLCGRFPFVQPRTCPDAELLAVKILQRYAMPREADTLKILDSRAQRLAMAEAVGVVTKSLRKDRKQRYKSADVMKKHVERINR